MCYIKQFIFFSVLGFFFEKTIGIITQNNYDSGILYGPYTPIYGFGILLIIYSSNFIFKHLHLKRYQENIIVFGFLFFFLTILELIGGILIENVFGKVFWSYKDFKFNYGHYISIEISLLWSTGGIIIYYFKNFLFKIINKIPSYIYFFTITIFIFDTIYLITKIK